MDHSFGFSSRTGAYHIPPGIPGRTSVRLSSGILPSTTHDWIRKYLSDPTEDVRVATESALADFLHEIRQVCLVKKQSEEQIKVRRDYDQADATPRPNDSNDQLSQPPLYIAEAD